jgi:hypothetical protein
MSGIDIVVPLDADTYSKLLASKWSFIVGFHGILEFLKFYQSTFLNQGCFFIDYPLSFTPNLSSGFGFNNSKIM